MTDSIRNEFTQVEWLKRAVRSSGISEACVDE